MFIKNKHKMTKKSKNSKINSSFMLQTNFEKQLEGAPICRTSNRGWVNCGKKNDYPQKLSELYHNSIIHKSCVDFAVGAIIGDGIDYDAMQVNQEELVPNYQQTWEDFIQAIALDFIIYGSYAFQIIKNRDGKTYSFYHQPISSVRCGERDEDGVITKYYISKDWTAIGKYPPIELDRFGFQDDINIPQGKPFLFVYETYTPDLDYYSSPRYVGGIKSIQTEIELIRYDLRAVKNNFSANGILVLPNVETDEEKQQLINQIKNSFVGADNANSLIVTFADGTESENLVNYTKLEKDVDDINLFSDTNSRVIDRIVTAHRIPSKALIGMPMDSTGFSNEGTLLDTAYQLYNRTVAKQNRENIVNTINKMLAMNGVDVKIILKPLTFGLEKVEENDVESNVIQPIQNISENNIEEKITNDEK